MLPLDDPRWADLDHRGWGDGARSRLDPGAPDVAAELTALARTPDDLERFSDLWPYLCSEGTTWAAAYAAAPHVVDLARRLPRARRVEHLVYLGRAVIHSCPELGDSFAIPPDLRASYERAVAEALPLLLETLSGPLDESDTTDLLAAAAALKRHVSLAARIERLDREDDLG